MRAAFVFTVAVVVILACESVIRSAHADPVHLDAGPTEEAPIVRSDGIARRSLTVPAHGGGWDGGAWSHVIEGSDPQEAVQYFHRYRSNRFGYETEAMALQEWNGWLCWKHQGADPSLCLAMPGAKLPDGTDAEVGMPWFPRGFYTGASP